MKIFYALIFLTCVSIHVQAQENPNPKITVHEWGTITTIHQLNGTPLGKLNALGVDHSLPEFVHRLDQALLQYQSLSKARYPSNGGHPDVTMRLETPVIYFYTDAKEVTLDVETSFQGGLLNEYYPTAEVSIKDVEPDDSKNMRLTAMSSSSLSWKNITITETATALKTENPIWLAPREVNSRPIKASNGESEQYLFYRGVAHLNSLIATELDSNGKIILKSPERPLIPKVDAIAIPYVWITSVNGKGQLAFEDLGPVAIPSARLQTLRTMDVSKWEPDDYGTEKFKNELKAALVEEGLYKDEAEALLNTWQTSYFKGEKGIRIFYILPRAWMDHYLPLKFSKPVDVTRVFVGRIDIPIK
jgi:hypothetical protein